MSQKSNHDKFDTRLQSNVSSQESPTIFYGQITMVKLVLLLSLHNSGTGTSGFIKLKNQITMPIYTTVLKFMPLCELEDHGQIESPRDIGLTLGFCRD